MIARSALACKLLAGSRKLLDFDCGDAVELLLDSLGVFLADVLLQRLGSAIDEGLGFLEAERGDFAYGLDGVDLIRAGILEDDGELSLLDGRRGCCGRCAAGHR